MPRLKISFDAPVIFTTHLSVRLSDINYGGHTGNDKYVGFLQEARIQWLNSIGFTSEMDMDGIGWIQSDLCIQYLSQSFYKDELSIELAIGDISRAGFELKYRLSNQKNSLIALAATTLLFFDYQRQKVVSIPSTFLPHIQKVKSYE